MYSNWVYFSMYHTNGKENIVLKYQVVYASRTGNTQKVAAKIFETLPGTSKDIQKVEEAGKHYGLSV